MNEQTWASATDVLTLLQLTRGRDCKRKLRLFACACARLLMPKLPALSGERFVQSSEQFADNPINPSQLIYAEAEAREAFSAFTLSETEAVAAAAAAVRVTVHHHSRRAAEMAYGSLTKFETYTASTVLAEPHLLVRDIFGNPFRPIDFAPWRTDTAVSLARGMYESRDFGAMPILADALQDAGCDNAEVLSHCRDAKQAHVRGCWVVDGVLGLV